MSKISQDLFLTNVSDKLAVTVNIKNFKSNPYLSNILVKESRYQNILNRLKYNKAMERIDQLTANTGTALAKVQGNPNLEKPIIEAAERKREAIMRTLPQGYKADYLPDKMLNWLSEPAKDLAPRPVLDHWKRLKQLHGDRITLSDFKALDRYFSDGGRLVRAKPEGKLPGAMPKSMQDYLARLTKGL